MDDEYTQAMLSEIMKMVSVYMENQRLRQESFKVLDVLEGRRIALQIQKLELEVEALLRKAM